MAIKLSVAVRNARLNAIEPAIGVSAVLKIRSGAPPALITDPDSGTVIATLTLPVDWMDVAAAGSITKLGTWQDLLADADGIAGHFRVYAADGTTQHMQGTITLTGAGGDMTLDNTNILHDQVVTVTGCTLTDGNG